MKQLLILAIPLLLFSHNLQAELVKGQVIYPNDTLDVHVLLPIFMISKDPYLKKLQCEVRCYTEIGEEIVVKPGHAKEIHFTYDGEEYKMVAKYTEEDWGHGLKVCHFVFLQVVHEGSCSLYKYYYRSEYSKNEDVYILEKNRKDLTWHYPTRSFLKNYFKDCPELVAAVKAREVNEVVAAVKVYNELCGAIDEE